MSAPAILNFQERFTYLKIQDGGRPPYWKLKNRDTSLTICPTATKFDTVTNFGYLLLAVEVPFFLLWWQISYYRTAKFGTVPNVALISQYITEILRFFDFQDVCRPSSWIFKNFLRIDKSSAAAVAEMGDRGHNRHGPKGGGVLCPFCGALGTRLLQCGLRGGLYFRTKWRLHSSSRLATIV